MDFGVVDVASCMGQETHTIHLNFQVGLKAHLEERALVKVSMLHHKLLCYNFIQTIFIHYSQKIHPTC
jgi:hypothetical protein